MLDDMKNHSPESGFNVVGIDEFEPPGEQLYFIEHFDSIEDAKMFALEREDNVTIIGPKSEEEKK